MTITSPVKIKVRRHSTFFGLFVELGRGNPQTVNILGISKNTPVMDKKKKNLQAKRVDIKM